MSDSKIASLLFLLLLAVLSVEHCHTLDPANLFQSLNLAWTEEMSRKACGGNKSSTLVVRRSHFLPLGTSFAFECPGLCLRAGQTTQSIWLFASEGRLLRLDRGKVGYSVDSMDGRLELDHLRHNGTFHCHANGNLFAQHSVTLTSLKLPVRFAGNVATKKSIVRVIDSLQIIFTQVVSRDHVHGVRLFRNRTRAMAIRKSVVECRLQIRTKLTAEQPQHRMLAGFDDFSCFDHLLASVVDGQQLTQVRDVHFPSYVLYEYSEQTIPNLADKPKTLKPATVKVVGSKIVLARLGTRVCVPCTAHGHRSHLYLWRRVLDNISIPITAKHVADNSKGRVNIDFLDNLVFDPVVFEDLKYRYECYAYSETSQQEVLVASKLIQLMPLNQSEESLWSLDNVATYIMISLMIYVALAVLRGTEA